MNPIIDALYRDQQFTLPDGQTIRPFPVSIKRAEGEALYHLVKTVQPQRTLEVGMAWGLSSLFICQALRDNQRGVHVAIDPFQSRFHHGGVFNVHRAGLSDLLTLSEEPSQTALARLVSEKQSFDFIFIDGAHLFDAAFVDFYFADLLIPVGAYLVFDDLWMPAVRKVLRFILRNRHYRIATEFMGSPAPFVQKHLQNLKYQARKRLKGHRNLGTGSEMALHLGRNVNWCVLQKAAPDDRPWDHFAPF